MSRRPALPVLPALVVALFGAAGCDGNGVRGSGTAETEARPAAAFIKVRASNAVQVVLTRGGTDGLTVSADDNLLPLLTAEVRGDVLVVGFAGNVRPRTPVRVEASAATLAEIEVSSAASLTASDLETDALAVTVSSAGFASLSGFCGDLTAELSSAAELSAARVRVEASSAARAKVAASESLTINASSAASVAYAAAPGVTPDVTLGSAATAEPAG